jgi:uncharacterized protein YcbK (DUF882 family)
MTPEQWETIKYFDQTEKWGDPAKMDYQLLQGLDALRKYVDREIIIHCGYEERASGGWHPMGQAVDLHINGLHPMEQYIAATRFQVFTGLGIYLWWNNPGIHLDNRPLDIIKRRSVWGSPQKNKYVGLDQDFIRKAMQVVVA